MSVYEGGSKKHIPQNNQNAKIKPSGKKLGRTANQNDLMFLYRLTI